MVKLWLKTIGMLFLIAILYVPHRYVILPLLEEKPSLEFLNFSYIFNLVATSVIILIIFLIARFSKEFLGFLFMAFGAFKLMLFLMLVHKLEFTLGRPLFLHFFFPYLCGLGVEIFFVKQELNERNVNSINSL